MNNSMERIKHNTVEEYLNALPDNERGALESLREILIQEIPDAEQVISYQIPVFKYRGMLVGFAAFKKHCSLFVMSKAVMHSFWEELKSFSKETGTVHFTHDKPLPVELVQRIVRARIAENDLLYKQKIEKKKKK